eukprot:TRINITY_DN3344_c0_g1_i2.p1 TRINITY_DN3344_c0_g1~~TRINITY_DN3344_c0_g1_i2.p1  ORF type:complete len:268 (-),score=58.18 TRINITY_DN3344_c0_g1_i2:126-929(-)
MALAGLPLAAAAAFGFLGAQSTSFVLAPSGKSPSLAGVSASAASARKPALHSASSSLPGTVCGGLAIGLVASAATASRTARRATETKPVASTGPFSGGLVGSEYAGFGRYEWDPLMLTKEFPEHLPWYREAELKHGRIAMLAMVGLIAPEGFRIPIDVLQDPELDLLNAHNKLIFGLGEGPMWWLLVFCAVIESQRFHQLGKDFGKLTLENAGDLNFGKGFLPKTEEGITQMKIKELKNGRLAMLAFSGAITQAAFFDVHHFPYYGQ